MNEDAALRPTYGMRFNTALDRAESIYLRVLRAVILVIATLLILYAAGLAAHSLYKMSRSPDSVVEETATVAPEELTDADLPSTSRPTNRTEAQDRTDPAVRRFYDDFVARYHRLFQAKFEPYRQGEDKRLKAAEFGDSFISPNERIDQIEKGSLNFATDRADLETLLKTMTAAADLETTRTRLQRYKSARKVRVCRNVQRTRTLTRSGWNPYSTDCTGWYTDPVGCPEQRTVETPYTARVCTMRFPEDTQSHTQIFRAFQDRYLSLLASRRSSNAATAQAARENIMFGQLQGEGSLMTALQVGAGFLVLMFFFLLIAIERHQRKLARALQDRETLVGTG